MSAAEGQQARRNAHDRMRLDIREGMAMPSRIPPTSIDQIVSTPTPPEPERRKPKRAEKEKSSGDPPRESAAREPKYAGTDWFKTPEQPPNRSGSFVRSGAPVRESVREGTPPNQKHQDFIAVVPDEKILHDLDRRSRMRRICATLFQGVPYGTYVNAAAEENGKKERTRWQLSVEREDTGTRETVVIYGFMHQKPVGGRYHIVGVRNAEREIEVDRMESIDPNTPIAIEQMPAGLMRFFFLLILLVPLGLIFGGTSYSGSFGAFLGKQGDYLTFYTVAILLAALYIWYRVRQRRLGRGNRRGRRR